MSFFTEETHPDSETTKMSLGEFNNRMSGPIPEIKVPDYQREYVWSKKQQERYLESLSKNMPLFGPVLNVDTKTGVQWIMDGQNRILTIRKFINGDITYKGLSFDKLPDNEKRRIKNMKMSYTETRDWSEEQCQDFFMRIQGGEKLKDGELIHARSENDLTISIVNILVEFEDFFKNKPMDGGLGFTKGYIHRYGHYEYLGTIMHMVRTNEYPLRPGKTALSECCVWEDENTPTLSQRETVNNNTIKLLHKYSQIVSNVVKLKQGVKKEEHLRLMYFIYKTNLWNDEMNEDIYNRIDSLLNRVLNKDNPEHDEITLWGTKDIDRIYSLYLEIYESM